MSGILEGSMTKRARSEKTKSIGRIVLGCYLILIGGLIFGRNLGVEIPHGIWSWWPFLLLAGGGAKMLFGGRDGLEEGFWMTLAGLYCWVSVWRLWGLSWGTAWPIFVIAGGLSMVLEPWFGNDEASVRTKREAEKNEVNHVG
jgi:hypothetical protein